MGARVEGGETLSAHGAVRGEEEEIKGTGKKGRSRKVEARRRGRSKSKIGWSMEMGGGDSNGEEEVQDHAWEAS